MRGLKNGLRLFILLIFGVLVQNTNVFADSEISISTSETTILLDVVPDVYSSASQSITVSTTSIAGYTVKLATTGASTDLVNQSDSTKVVSTFSLPAGDTSIPVSSIGYGYGYSVDSGLNYRPMPDPAGTPDILFTTNTSGSNTHTLTYGAKVSSSHAVGTYTNTFDIIAVANLQLCDPDTICYYGNNDDRTGTMSDQSVSSNSEATLIPSNFSRSGYGFAGWNTAPDGSGTNYGPNQTITTSDLSLNGLQLYANWVASSGTIQNWNGCASLNRNQIIALTDSRDGNVYTVTKYADDKCWMMENLRLDFSKSDLEINAVNTNNPLANFAQTINNSHPAPTNTFCTGNGSTCADTIQYNTDNINRSLTASYNSNNNASSWYSYGNYYNWYTATAGQGTYSMSVAGSTANGDICPAGWRLPTGYGTTGDLSVLDSAIGGSGKNQTSGTAAGLAGSARWRSYPYNFIFSGEQKDGVAANRGASDSFATANVSNAERTINLWVKEDGVYMKSNTTLKIRGQTIRCTVNDRYSERGNIHYDANGGTGTMNDEIDVNFATALAANNAFTRANYVFVSWNTSPSGNGVIVAEGGSVASAASAAGITGGGTLTLYAIWRPQYTIVYDGNGTSTGNMASANTTAFENSKISLVPPNYSRPGYGFAGWSLDQNASTKIANNVDVAMYGPNESVTINSGFIANADPTNNQITLYATWIPQDATYTLQTFTATECASLGTGKILALKDSRDDNVYTVAKLPDGNCWMTENLRLDPSVTPLNDQNTNRPTLTFSQDATSASSTTTFCSDDTSGCINQIAYNTDALDFTITPSYTQNNTGYSWYSYGTFYNWYTATAGNGDYSTTSTSVGGDICPANWRLPTGGSSGEYNTLNSQMNGGVTSSNAGFVKFPANFIYSGDYNTNKPGGRNTYGRYWTSTPNAAATAHRFGLATSGVTPTGAWNKWVAFSVRCIVK